MQLLDCTGIIVALWNQHLVVKVELVESLFLVWLKG